MDMVEKVARKCMFAALRTVLNSPDDIPSLANIQREWNANADFWRTQARAAIQAMREPAGWMETEGECALAEPEMYVPGSTDEAVTERARTARLVWRTMIDAALQPAIDGGEG